jgi:hypothetical protein
MLQESRNPRKNVSVQTQRVLDAETLTEMIMQKEQELELLNVQLEFERKALRNPVEVRNISVSKYFSTLTSWNSQLLILYIWYTRDVPYCIIIRRLTIKNVCKSILSQCSFDHIIFTFL